MAKPGGAMMAKPGAPWWPSPGRHDWPSPGRHDGQARGAMIGQARGAMMAKPGAPWWPSPGRHDGQARGAMMAKPGAPWWPSPVAPWWPSPGRHDGQAQGAMMAQAQGQGSWGSGHHRPYVASVNNSRPVSYWKYTCMWLPIAFNHLSTKLLVHIYAVRKITLTLKVSYTVNQLFSSVKVIIHNVGKKASYFLWFWIKIHWTNMKV